MQLTVAMSVLNGEPHLGSAVESILNQTHTDFTFIVVNNGSTDRTGEILEEYAARDPRMRVLHNETTVTYVEGRTRAIEQADTEWIALMDADDISEPERFEKQIQVLNRHGDKIAALGTWGRYINAKGKVLGQTLTSLTTIEQFERRFRANEPTAIIDPSAIIHRPTFLAAGGYRAVAAPAADLDLWYRLAEGGRAILVVPEFLFRYRIHGGGESVKKTMLQRKKTHYINYNMRRRRSGLEEITWDDYLRDVWSKFGYRLSKTYTDLALTFYKHAGLYYGSGAYGKFAMNLAAAALLKPAYVLNRFFYQKLSFSRKLATR